MEVHFRTMQGFERPLAEVVLKMCDQSEVSFGYRGVRTRDIRVFQGEAGQARHAAAGAQLALLTGICDLVPV